MAKRKSSSDSTQGKSKQPCHVEKPSNNMSFSLRIAKHVLQQSLKTKRDENMICSPASIDAILSMLTVGASGQLLEQLLQLLGYDNLEEVNAAASSLASVLKEPLCGVDAPCVAFANALWLNQRFSLNKSYKKVLRKVHKAKAATVDCHEVNKVIKTVNAWAEKETKGLIKAVLSRDHVSCKSALLLANALYFKGIWDQAFKRADTRDAEFHLLNGGCVNVPFMNQTKKNFDYGTFAGCQVLRMPYKNGKSTDGESERSFSMYIFLPKETDGLYNLMDNIDMNVSILKDQIKLQDVKINRVSIPKFRFDCDLGLVEPMQQLGLTSLFDASCKDLSNIITTDERLYVSSLLQKCHVAVDEQGTKAAAGTTCTYKFLCKVHILTPINFVADHPFMFMIKDEESGAVLFIGTVLDPRQG